MVVSVADRAPVPPGVKLIATVQPPPAASDPLLGHVPVFSIAKSVAFVPLIAIAPILRDATEVLLIVTVRLELFTPLTWLPRSRDAAESLTDGFGAKIVTVAVSLDRTPSLTKNVKLSVVENPAGGVYWIWPLAGSSAPTEPSDGPLTRL